MKYFRFVPSFLAYFFIFALVFSFFSTMPFVPLIAHAETATIRQEINILDSTLGANATSSEQVQLDTTKYGGAAGAAQYYFEVLASVTSGSATTSLQRVGSTTADAQITVTATSPTLYRVAFSPPAATATQYDVVSTGGTSPAIKAARIIVIQSGNPITQTETQIEIGNNETGKTNITTSTGVLAAPKYWKYDATKWGPAPTGFVEVDYAAGANITVASSFSKATVGDASWTVPTSISPATATIYLWGGGGGGGDAAANPGAGGGGSGGSVSILNSTSVTPGAKYDVLVGAAGIAGATGGSNGGRGATSTFNGTVVVATGGLGGIVDGAGGIATTTGNVGDVSFAGGNGAAGVVAASSGGGGGGAGSGSVGGNALLGAGGTGGTGTFTGGNGANGTSTAASNGAAGSNPGGGGAGGKTANTTDRAGGAGGLGQAKITYTIITSSSSPTIVLQHSTNLSVWTDDTIIVTRGTATSPVLARVGFVPTSGDYYRLVSKSATTTVSYSIYDAKIILDQAGGSNITKLEPQYLLSNTLALNTSANQKSFETFDPKEWAGVSNTYIHQVDASSTASSTVNLLNVIASTTLNTISGATTTVLSTINSVVGTAMFGSNSNSSLDFQISQNASTTYADRVLVDVTMTGPVSSTGLQIRGGGTNKGKVAVRGGGNAQGGSNFVQSQVGVNNFGGTSAATGFGSNNKAGDTIVAVIQWYMDTGASSINAVTDTNGNTYAILPDSLANIVGAHEANLYTEIAYATNIHAGANTVGVDWNNSVRSGFLSVYEISPSVLDQASASSGISATPSAGTVTTKFNKETAFATMVLDDGVGSPGLYAAGSGWILSQVDGGGNVEEGTEVQVASGASSLTGNSTAVNSGAWAASMATFRSSVAGIDIR